MTAATASEVEALRDRFRDAAAAGAPLRIVGGGTWLDAGRPVPNSDAVSMRAFDGITEYVPGDLTLTARGGTTLAEIRDATAAHGQWLALDPHGSDEGTIGATVATASAPRCPTQKMSTTTKIDSIAISSTIGTESMTSAGPTGPMV